MKFSELKKLAKKYNWVLDRISGSHYIYKKNKKILIIPHHNEKDLKDLSKKIEKRIKN